MHHLRGVAHTAGFQLVREGPRTLLLVPESNWQRTFHDEDSLAVFLRAAMRGQALRARDFRTAFDANPAMRGYLREQYRKGYRMARQGAVIYIGTSGSWSADVPSVLGADTAPRVYGYVTAYEVLGGACGTAELLQGWRDGGAIIVDYRPVPRARIVA